jgi:hypothetical protein
VRAIAAAPAMLPVYNYIIELKIEICKQTSLVRKIRKIKKILIFF